MNEIISEIYARYQRYEDAEDKRLQREKERKAKGELANKRRREAAWHVRAETREIKHLRKQIAANEAIMRLTSSFAFAFNTTNEMFRYPERLETEGQSKLEAENDGLRVRISEVEALKNAKLAELRKARKAGQR